MPLRSALSSSEFAALRQLSARVGADPLLVQGAGGNTSIKDNGFLWIKASGKWLAHAQRDDIFVPVLLGPLLARLADNDPGAEKTETLVVQEQNPSGLRPSIETTVHALLPQRIVVHVHCVNTIALAVRTDAEEQAASLLSGQNFAFIPYRRPGLPLARAIEERLRPGTDILVLGNHGLVVAAQTVAQAEQLLKAAISLLRRPARPVLECDEAALLRLAGSAGYRLPADPRAHGGALDAAACRFAAGGSLYPDHVVFLGVGSRIAGPHEDAASIAAAAVSEGRAPPVSILFPGKGVLMRQDAGAGAEAMAGCLADVTRRIGKHARLRYLNESEHGELMNWDAEKYRQQLNAPGGAASK